MYALQVLNIEDIPNEPKEGESKTTETKISFLEMDAIGILPQNEDPMVITVRCDN